MILYLDSSSLFKCLVEEDHGDDVAAWAEAADVVAASRVAYPEVAAALARKRAGGQITSGDMRRALGGLEAAWEDCLVVDLAERLAAELAVRYVLRGFDAVHLAAAVTLRDAVGDDGIAFSSFDAELNRAAVAEGLIVLEPGG
jgi:predicted nucleic acid-binding protein